jgi:hypothetical protein
MIQHLAIVQGTGLAEILSRIILYSRNFEHAVFSLYLRST